VRQVAGTLRLVGQGGVSRPEKAQAPLEIGPPRGRPRTRCRGAIPSEGRTPLPPSTAPVATLAAPVAAPAAALALPGASTGAPTGVLAIGPRVAPRGPPGARRQATPVATRRVAAGGRLLQVGPELVAADAGEPGDRVLELQAQAGRAQLGDQGRRLREHPGPALGGGEVVAVP